MEVRENIFLEDAELELESYINKRSSFFNICMHLHTPMISNITHSPTNLTQEFKSVS